MIYGMLQPGRLGDILILLPAAKHYVDQGHEVVWPIWPSMSAICRHAPYVSWVLIPEYTCAPDSIKAYVPVAAEWLDPFFGFSGKEQVSKAWGRLPASLKEPLSMSTSTRSWVFLLS